MRVAVLAPIGWGLSHQTLSAELWCQVVKMADTLHYAITGARLPDFPLARFAVDCCLAGGALIIIELWWLDGGVLSSPPPPAHYPAKRAGQLNPFAFSDGCGKKYASFMSRKMFLELL